MMELSRIAKYLSITLTIKEIVMATTAAASKPATKKPATKKPVAKEKQKPVAFINWQINDEDGETILRSSRGFSLFDNEYLTLEDKALIELAQNNDGEAIIMAELRVVIAKEKPTKLDTSKIKLVKR